MDSGTLSLIERCFESSPLVVAVLFILVLPTMAMGFIMWLQWKEKMKMAEVLSRNNEALTKLSTLIGILVK